MCIIMVSIASSKDGEYKWLPGVSEWPGVNDGKIFVNHDIDEFIELWERIRNNSHFGIASFKAEVIVGNDCIFTKLFSARICEPIMLYENGCIIGCTAEMFDVKELN